MSANPIQPARRRGTAVLEALETSTPTLSPTNENPLERWHPKLTPYRLTVILTTIGLGTVKLVEVYNGNDTGTTTLEWISGVVVFLL